jgi:LDH2 family malate/lactate/ureidoglycolate dehydrogenase
VSAIPSNRYRLDDLRRLATTLASGVGLAPARASALATHLLWFDAAGASSYGIATLPGWLRRIERGEIDPISPGKVVLERPGTAVFDAGRGVPPLALETAAGIASEKARDVGVGVVRVQNLGPTGPAAPVAANLAIGPFVAVVIGPSSTMAIALPTAEGLPSLYDSALAGGESPPEGWRSAVGPWTSALAGGEGWLILALSVPALEPISSFHQRTIPGLAGPLASQTLAARRLEARERGIALDAEAVASLKEWTARAKISWPPESAG